MLEDALFTLLRIGLGVAEPQPSGFALSAEDWERLYSMAGEQSVLGIAYAGIERLPKDAQPPMELAFQWASEAETVRGHNRLVNAEASRLTELFAAAVHGISGRGSHQHRGDFFYDGVR